MPPHDHPESSEISVEFIADPALANAVEKRSKACPPCSDGVLFRQGEESTYLYYVKSGEVALGMEAGTRLVMCVRAGPGSLVGLPAVVSNQPYSMTAAPCTGADIRQIGGPEFRHLVAENPNLAVKVLELLAAEVRLARRSYSELIS